MKATKIKMQTGCSKSQNLLEIDEIFIMGCNEERFYKKALIYDHLIKHPQSIQVNIYPYPELVPVLSSNYEKYVKSSPNKETKDNLLSLPRE